MSDIFSTNVFKKWGMALAIFLSAGAFTGYAVTCNSESGTHQWTHGWNACPLICGMWIDKDGESCTTGSPCQYCDLNNYDGSECYYSGTRLTWNLVVCINVSCQGIGIPEVEVPGSVRKPCSSGYDCTICPE